MSDYVQGAFASQRELRGSAITKTQGPAINYDDDNLFAGVWRLNQDNLNRFDAFLTGYASIIWVKPCRFMEKSSATYWSEFKAFTERNFKALTGINDFTLDSDNITIGFAGNDFPVITNLKKDITQFSLRHYELAGSPVREFYQYWITGIRDPDTGLAHYHGMINMEDDMYYSIRNHSAELMYIVTDPSHARSMASSDSGFGSGARGNREHYGIEYSCLFTNSVPTKVPQEHLNYTSGDHGLIEIDIDFRACYHQSKDINSLANDIMATYSIKRMFGDYQARETLDLAAFNLGYNEKGEAATSNNTQQISG